MNCEKKPYLEDICQQSYKEYQNNKMDISLSYDNFEIQNIQIKDKILGENYDKIKWDQYYFK